MDYVTIKVYDHTRTVLRMIAAHTGEQMAKVVERLCDAELARIADEAQRTGETVILIGHTRKGKSHVTDQFTDRGRESAGDESGEHPVNNASDGSATTGDNAI